MAGLASYGVSILGAREFESGEHFFILRQGDPHRSLTGAISSQFLAIHYKGSSGENSGLAGRENFRQENFRQENFRHTTF